MLITTCMINSTEPALILPDPPAPETGTLQAAAAVKVMY